MQFDEFSDENYNDGQDHILGTSFVYGIKSGNIESVINSFYDSRKMVIEKLDSKFGSGYSELHADEVSRITGLLETQTMIWKFANYLCPDSDEPTNLSDITRYLEGIIYRLDR